MNLILNNKSNEQVNQWISVLLRFKEIERADMEYFHSHVSDVVSFISKENLDAINGLFAANNLQPIGVNRAEVTLGIADEDLPF